jgi:hypothetical protein
MRMAMMAITTNSSISVNPRRVVEGRDTVHTPLDGRRTKPACGKPGLELHCERWGNVPGPAHRLGLSKLGMLPENVSQRIVGRIVLNV